MRFDKLIRDKIIENWDLKYGNNPKWHTASDKEFEVKLKEKLLEEVQEFIKDDNKEEIADILEVIDAICDLKGFDIEEIKEIKKQKAIKNGAFKKRLILDS